MTRSWLPLLIALLPFTAGGAEHGSLADQLRALSSEHGFALKGVENTADAPASRASGELPVRLRAMLRDFGFVLEQPPGGPIKRLIIIGPKGEETFVPPESADEGETLETERSGVHHMVSATLLGREGQEVALELMVDTGATSVVLPRSMLARLGIPESDLTPREVQTATGRVTAATAPLPGLRLGSQEIRDVEAAFIEDDKLGKMALLGMSVLDRYNITLNGESNTLELQPSGEATGAGGESGG